MAYKIAEINPSEPELAKLKIENEIQLIYRNLQASINENTDPESS